MWMHGCVSPGRKTPPWSVSFLRHAGARGLARACPMRWIALESGERSLSSSLLFWSAWYVQGKGRSGGRGSAEPLASVASNLPGSPKRQAGAFGLFASSSARRRLLISPEQRLPRHPSNRQTARQALHPAGGPPPTPFESHPMPSGPVEGGGFPPPLPPVPVSTLWQRSGPNGSRPSCGRPGRDQNPVAKGPQPTAPIRAGCVPLIPMGHGEAVATRPPVRSSRPSHGMEASSYGCQQDPIREEQGDPSLVRQGANECLHVRHWM